MTDSKTPEWAGPRYFVHIIPANNKVQMLERSDGDWVKFSDASQSLLSAYERGRKEGIEEAAKVVQAHPDTVALPEEDVARFGMFARQANRSDLSQAIRHLLEVKG